MCFILAGFNHVVADAFYIGAARFGGEVSVQYTLLVAMGNAIGSIICNAALIAAITIAVRPAPVKRDTILLPVAAFFAAALFYCAIAYTTGRFQRWHGIVLLGMFIVYMFYSIRKMKSGDGEAPAAEEAPKEEEKKETSLMKELLMLVVGAVAIAFGANLLVENGTIIASALGVPDSVIGLTMVALGTSLPELITAITSLRKGIGAMSLGNVIGANLFNLVLVSGTAITISPFAVPSEKMIAGMNSSLLVDIPVMLGVMIILCFPAVFKEKLYKWQGYLLLGIYVLFTIYQFVV